MQRREDHPHGEDSIRRKIRILRRLEALNRHLTARLVVIGGVATDKVLAHEKSQTDDGASYLSALERVAGKFMEGGQGIELKVAISPVTPGVEANDVTAKHESGGH